MWSSLNALPTQFLQMEVVILSVQWFKWNNIMAKVNLKLYVIIILCMKAWLVALWICSSFLLHFLSFFLSLVKTIVKHTFYILNKKIDEVFDFLKCYFIHLCSPLCVVLCNCHSKHLIIHMHINVCSNGRKLNWILTI